MHSITLACLVVVIAIQIVNVTAFGFGGMGGGGGCGCGAPPPSCGCGRKKRDVSYVRGHVSGARESGPAHAQCNSPALGEVILQHLNEPSDVARTAIHKQLSEQYPEDDFAVLCIDGPVSYIADSERYCMEGNSKHNCYVFSLYTSPSDS